MQGWRWRGCKGGGDEISGSHDADVLRLFVSSLFSAYAAKSVYEKAHLRCRFTRKCLITRGGGRNSIAPKTTSANAASASP